MFINNYNQEAVLFIALLKKGRDFYIRKKELKAFEILKNKLKKIRILIAFNQDLKTKIKIDTIDKVLKACLI